MNNIGDSWWEFTNYKPHSGQEAVHTADNRFRCVIAGRRWGKSLCAAKEIERYMMLPNKMIWIVAPNYELSDKVFKMVWKHLVIENKVPMRRKSERDRFMITEWGSELHGKSADAPDSCLGEGVDFLVLDEFSKFTKRIWEQYLRPTLSDKKGKMLAISTPDGYNWAYDLYLRGKSPQHLDWKSFQSPSWINPLMTEEEMQTVKATLTKETFLQEYAAEFVTYAGKVFPFDRDIHIKEMEIESGYPLLGGIDFGFQRPSVGFYQVIRKDGKIEEIHLIDEITNLRNVTTDQLINAIHKKPYRVREWCCDPQGVQPNAQTGLGDIEIFRRSGFRMRYSHDRLDRHIPSGIELVRSYFENAKGEAKFFVHPRCKGHISSFENYRYPEQKEGKPTKDLPLKDGVHDHACDETRYFFVNHIGLRKNKIRRVKW